MTHRLSRPGLVDVRPNHGLGREKGTCINLKSQFKVIDAEGYDDGEPVSNVTFEEKTTERYSTDIQELNTQLDKLAEYQQEIQEDRDALIEEEATGGGWGRLLRRRCERRRDRRRSRRCRNRVRALRTGG